jgi:hypothetical protein
MSTATLETRGRFVVEASPKAPPRSACLVVRIYYRSAGGEVLAMDSERLTADARDELVRGLPQPGATAFLDHDVLREDEVERVKPRLGARLVVNPGAAANRPVRVEGEESRR